MLLRMSRVGPYLFFVISGACGLVYEVTWGKYLALFLGNTSLAYMCVLASFMGGLAIGSFLLGALSARLSRPLALYGLIEVAIGLYAIVFPLLMHPVQSTVLAQAASLGFGSPAWIALKLAASLIVLLLPTILMGGTFPLLMKHFQPRSVSAEDKAEWLYATNCTGAVVGALLAGFMFIPSIGLRHTLWYVGFANVVLGAAALALGRTARRAAQGGGETIEPKPASAEVTDSKARRPLRPVYAAIAISGATSMVYELVWIRMFAITLGGSTYAFTLMVAAFITGIAIGSLFVAWSPRLRHSPLIAFAIAEIAIGGAILASLPLYQRLPYVFAKWSSLLNPSPDSMWLYSLFQYSICFVVMLIPTIFFGATLPLAIKAVARRDGRIGRDSGFVYGANTVGTLAGALLTGLVLMPVFGLRHSLEVALTANVAIGALLLWAHGLPRMRLAAIAVAPIALLLVSLVPHWHPASFTMGARGLSGVLPTWSAYEKTLDKVKVRFFGEDGAASVAVFTTADSGYGQPDDIMTINGKADASSFGDLPTEVLLGQTPMMLKPNALDVLIIGLGSGVTAGSVLTHPGATVDCVEISPAVAQGARFFDSVNGGVLQSDRFRLIVEDARTYVSAGTKKYHIIVSEPSNPWVAGVGNLFSLEFFRSVDRALMPDGLLVQWFHSYGMTDELTAVMLRTVQKVFPYTYLFEGQTDDYIVVASRKPIHPDFAAMEECMRVEEVRRDFERISIRSLAAFLGRQCLGAQQMTKLAGSGPINTDDLPIIEYQAPVAIYARSTASGLVSSDQRLLSGKGLFSTAYLGARRLNSSECISLLESYCDRRTENPRLQAALLRYYNNRWPGDSHGLTMYSQRMREIDLGVAQTAARDAVQASADSAAYQAAAEASYRQYLFANSVFTPQDIAPAIRLMDRAIALAPDNHALRARRLEMMRSAR